MSVLNRLPVLALALATLSLGLLVARPAYAAPEPSPVATNWEFTFEPGPLRLAWVTTEDGPQAFFYLTYKITNFWGNDLLFAPGVQLVNDESEVINAGDGISGPVTDEIMGRLRNPFLQSQIGIVGTVLSGPEHAREGIAIWRATDLDVDEVSVFFGGLSGEFETFVVGRDTDDPRRYQLRKTLMLRYATPGDISQQGSRPLELIEERWVMR